MAKKQVKEPCLFCGGDVDAPDHKRSCPGAIEPATPIPPPAPEPPANAEPYTNQGKGLVLKNNSTTKKVADLFDERAYWTSKELNDRVGWQFSQAIFALRQKGMAIRTLRIGPKAYAYQRVASL